MTVKVKLENSQLERNPQGPRYISHAAEPIPAIDTGPLLSWLHYLKNELINK